MKHWIFIFGLLILTFSLSAQVLNPDSLNAEQAFYQQTLQKLEAKADSGVKNADLFYDIGVCHYQMGNTGKAVLYFLRALNLNSAHKQAKQNLLYIHNLHPELSPEPNRPFLVQLFLNIYDFFSLNRLAITLLILAILLTLSLHWLMHTPSEKERGLPILAVVITAILFIAFGSMLLVKNHRYRNDSRAVVIANVAPIYHTPESNNVLQTIPEGSVVVAIKTLGKKTQIILPDGTQGWVDSNSIERVVPVSNTKE